MRKILVITAICAMFVSYSSCTNNRDQTPVNYPNENKQRPADWEITANVKKNLMTDSSLSASARMISVTTNNGVVTLTGTVVNKEESHRVIKIVNAIYGVKSVDNQLTIAQCN